MHLICEDRLLLLFKLDATTNKQKKNHVLLELSLVQIQSLVITGQNNGTILELFLQINPGRSSSQSLCISFTIGPQRSGYPIALDFILPE
jgi:hypothetical protein